MQQTLHRMRARTADERGFTLIELLVVVVIIGVLVAIAIPVYLNYRKGAENKSTQSDLRGAISVVEQFYTENGNVYPASLTSTAGQTSMVFPAIGTGTAETVKISAGNIVGLKNNTATYVLCASNSDTGVVYAYNSDPNSTNAGNVKKSTAADVPTCLTNGG